MIREVERVVEEACAKECNVFGYSVWTHHITQVTKNVRRLAPLFNADVEIVEIAALLHDYASIKDKDLYGEHHIYSALEAERLLKSLGYEPKKIELVKHCILAHRASVPMEKQSVEATCLANADAMAHIEHVSSLLYLAFVQYGMGIDEGTAWVKAKVERSWQKMSRIVQKNIKEKYEAALIILSAPSALDFVQSPQPQDNRDRVPFS